MTGSSWRHLCVWRECLCAVGARADGKSAVYCFAFTPFSAWVTVGSHLPVSISTQLSYAAHLSLALAAVLIAQEETCSLLPRRICRARCTRCAPQNAARRRSKESFQMGVMYEGATAALMWQMYLHVIKVRFKCMSSHTHEVCQRVCVSSLLPAADQMGSTVDLMLTSPHHSA